jgi:PKD repeat protein
MMQNRNINILLLLLFSLAFRGEALAQCPQFFDSQGILSNNPQWVSCFGTAYNFNLISDVNIGNYTIDWGDGSPVTNGNGWLANTAIPHNYTATVANYNVVITLPDVPCVVNGLVIMEEPSNASIQIPFGGLTSVCAPGNLDFVNSSTAVSTNTFFTWDFGDGSPIQNFNSTNAGQTVLHTYLQGTVNCITTVTLTAENVCNTLQGGESVATFNPIRIWDIDDAAITASATLLCYPDTTVTLQNTTNRNCEAQGNIAQRYEYWNFGDYWGLGYDSILNWTAWPPALPITMEYPGIGTYTAMLIDSSFCGLDMTTITIQIVAPPTAGLNSSQDTICEGESVTFNNLAAAGANTYSWNFGDGTGWQNLGAGAVAHTYNFTGDYLIQLAVFIGGGTASCTDTASILLHVLPRPTANFNFDNNNGCDSLTVNFTDFSSANVVTWLWSFGNGNTSNLPVPPAQFYASSGNYNVQLDVASVNGCSHSLTQTIDVYESPTPSFIPTSVCQNVEASFLDQSTSSVGDPIITWSWDFGDGNSSVQQNPNHVFITPGPVNLILEVSTLFCTATDTISVTVETEPTASFLPSNTIGCSPLGVSFANNSTLNATNFSWDFGDGNTSTATNPVHTYLNNFGVDTVFSVTLISQTTFGCADTIVQQITVFPNPSAAFVNDGVLDCAPLIINFTNNSSGAVSYSWDFGDGTPLDNAVNPSHVYNNASQFIDNNMVTLIAISANGCSDTLLDSLIVYPEPQFGFSTTPDSGCSPATIIFPSVIGAVQYQWDFGDGSFGGGPTPTHMYLNSTTNNVLYTIQLIATSPFNCVDTTSKQVLVFPNPTAQFSVDITSGCHPLPVTITNASIGGSFYHWDMGDATLFDTSVVNFTHVYTNTTGIQQSYQMELIAETNKGCKDTAVRNVAVYPELIANFSSDTIGCSPLNVLFNNISSGALNYTWDFGDASPTANAINPSHVFNNSSLNDTIYTVTLVIESVFGCFDTTSSQITVHPDVIAQFSIHTNAGCHPLPVSFTNSTIGASFYNWYMGDSVSFDTLDLSFNHTYMNISGVQQDHDALLIATSIYGCTDTFSRNIVVYPDVTAIFDYDTSGCSPFDMSFLDISLGGVSYTWDFGDGSPLENAQHPAHQYVNTTANDIDFTATLIIESVFGCLDTVQNVITVFATPVVAFTPFPATQTYPSATVAVTNTSFVGPWLYAWNFGDSTLSNMQNPQNHTYNTWGVYQIQLIAENPNCADTAIQTITIIPPVPVASFQGPAQGCRPVEVQFSNFSEYGNSYLWDFGDGGTSTQFAPSYTYYNPGVYTVTLTVVGDGGQDVETQQLIIEVYQNAIALFTVSPTIVYIPTESILLFNLSTFALSYTWDFGDGNSSSEEHPEHIYTEQGTYDITLIATNQNNCKDTFVLSAAVEALSLGSISVPNAFTPNPAGGNGGLFTNQDLNNDVFHPIIVGADVYELNIFNKWGELLFISLDVNIGWDGYYRNELSKQDVYIYKVKVTYLDGRSESIVGDVTLLR